MVLCDITHLHLALLSIYSLQNIITVVIVQHIISVLIMEHIVTVLMTVCIHEVSLTARHYSNPTGMKNTISRGKTLKYKKMIWNIQVLLITFDATCFLRGLFGRVVHINAGVPSLPPE